MTENVCVKFYFILRILEQFRYIRRQERRKGICNDIILKKKNILKNLQKFMVYIYQ